MVIVWALCVVMLFGGCVVVLLTRRDRHLHECAACGGRLENTTPYVGTPFHYTCAACKAEYRDGDDGSIEPHAERSRVAKP